MRCVLELVPRIRRKPTSHNGIAWLVSMLLVPVVGGQNVYHRFDWPPALHLVSRLVHGRRIAMLADPHGTMSETRMCEARRWPPGREGMYAPS